MPTTRSKNALYRIMLPFCAPVAGEKPVSAVIGHKVLNIDKFVQIIRKHHVLGSSTLIVSQGQSSLICTSSDNPLHRAEEDTFYRVASITKMATSVLIMRLTDLNILSIDIPVSDCFPDKREKQALHEITLRQLLSHTSGIIDPVDLETSMEKGIPFSEIVPAARQYSPGSAFHYSNLGFGLIGCILEAKLNQPVGQIFREYLFRPLGMKATLEGYQVPKEKIMPVSRVLPYRKGNDLILTKLGSVPLQNPDPLRHYGHTAGSMYTDVASLHMLMKVLNGENISFLSENALKTMRTDHAAYGSVSPTLTYGLGLLHIQDHHISEYSVYGHQGFAYGCVDGAFWEEKTGRILITLNGGCSEARSGRLGLSNRDFIRWAFRKELPLW